MVNQLSRRPNAADYNGIPQERLDTNELQPLSNSRAQAVVDQFVGYGVARGRLSSTGRGGTRTVANAKDPDNNWKNRRVEFILIK